ncbi:MAG: CheR family methyltransferase, partial [Alphaproteobacteria bacterium]
MTEMPPSIAQVVSDDAFGPLKSHIVRLTGLAYYNDKEDALAERLARRMAVNGIPDCAGYLRLLTSGSAALSEVDALVSELTVGETFFFRYIEQFEALRTTILPECLERNRTTRRLRLWSAGCATGAEPYSVAVLVEELLGPQLPEWNVTLLATDINRDFLAQAKTGRYGSWALRSITETQKSGLFEETNGLWHVKRKYRDMVTFAYHNLVTLCDEKATPIGHEAFDVILCRNVLIYFDRPSIRSLLPQLSRYLTDRGWLLVGHSEPSEDFSQTFDTVSAPGATLYRKALPAPPPPIVAESPPIAARPPTRSHSPLSRPMPPRPMLRPPLPKLKPNPLSEVVALADQGHWEEARRVCDQLLDANAMNPVAHYY